MLATMVRVRLRSRSLVQIRRVAPVPFDTPEPAVSRIYREVERDFGVLAPPVALHAASPATTAAVWLMLRETLVAPGAADRADKEAVADGISRSNSCPYCVTMHGAMLDALGAGAGSVRVRDWAETNAIRGAAVADELPFREEAAPELVATAVLMHYLNRMVNVFLGEAPLPPKAPVQALKVVTPVLNWLQRSADRDAVTPGTSMDLLPRAPLPADMAWTAGNPVLTDAFSRAAAAIDRVGEQALPADVRELVLTRLKAWDGTPPGISRAWVEEAVGVLAPDDRAAGRLALLAAFASYQIDDAVVDAYRATADGQDARLIEATAWASLSAAREAASWMITKK
jgi:AhpD family alkylhydroperoxidase